MSMAAMGDGDGTCMKLNAGDVIHGATALKTDQLHQAAGRDVPCICDSTDTTADAKETSVHHVNVELTC